MALDAIAGTTNFKDTKEETDTAGVKTTVETIFDKEFNIIGSKVTTGDDSYESTISKDTDGMSEAAAVGNNAALVLAGALAASGAVANTSAQTVSITSSGDDSGISFTVVGTNALGEALTESVTGANAGSATSTNLFSTISSITAVGDPAGTVSVAGEGYTEVVLQTASRIEKNEAGEDVAVAFKVEKTLEFDADAKIISGTEKIDGKEKTLGADGVVTAETMDTSALGNALTGTALAAVAARYDAVAADATIYAEEENVGGGVKVTTLYAANGTVVGSSDTAVETFGDMTLTVTNHLDASGVYIGTSGTDGTNTCDYT